MKKLILTLGLLFSTFLTIAQIGVITLKKNESVPLNMWYTIDEKDREDNLYITFDNEDLAVYTLGNLLGQFDMEIELPNDKDVDGDPYWTVEQENGYISDIYYIKEKNYSLYTITIVSAWGGE
jgi:hypothetical protein